jgi:hypothetical protein
MGTKPSIPQTPTTSTVEVRGETNLKLEAQKIKDFTGGHEDWAKWKSRTQCAFSESGYEMVLEDEVYAAMYECLNKVVYSQLAAATVEGVPTISCPNTKTPRMGMRLGRVCWIGMMET